MAQIRTMEKVFDFVRERIPWCYGCNIVPQVAVFMSARDHYIENSHLFGRDGNEKIMGLVSILCDMGHGVSVVSEYDFDGRFPLVVLPELHSGLDADMASRLLKYVREGGSLLICGYNAISSLADAGAPLIIGEAAPERRLFSLDGSEFASVYGGCAASATGGEIIAKIYDDERAKGEPFAGIMPYGKGRVAWIGADFGTVYNTARQAGHTRLVRVLLDKLYTPLVGMVSAEGTVEMTPLSRDGRLLIQLVNMNGPHHDTRAPSFEGIQPCRDIRLSVSLPSRPSAVVQRPSGTPLKFSYDGSNLLFELDRLELYEIIEIES